jgi:hypothetical protein
MAKRLLYKAYLAGGGYSNWRDQLVTALAPQLKGYDPFRQSRQTAAWLFVQDDLKAVDDADLVIAYYPGGYPSHGMAAEIGYAAAIGRPVFYVDETDAPDMFLIGCSKRFFPSLAALTRWWQARQEAGKPII